jgi:hypothetical protein
MSETKPRLILALMKDGSILGGHCSLCYEPFYGSQILGESSDPDPHEVEKQFARHVKEKHDPNIE